MGKLRLTAYYAVLGFYRSIEVSHADDTGNGRAEVSCFLNSATLCKWEHPLNQAEQN